MRIDQGCFSHIGRRQEQQDAYGFSDFEDSVFVSHGGIMAIVCDGMGGLDNGGDAARIAVKSILDCYMSKTPEQAIHDALDHAVVIANSAVVQLGLKTDKVGNVGTTLAVVVIFEDQLFWRTAGDSRIYLRRKKNLRKLNIEHTYTHELLQNLDVNSMSEEDAINHPNGSALVSYLGIGESLQIDKNEIPIKLQTDDVLLICTDGLYNSITEDDIYEALINNDAMEAAKVLQHKTLDKQYLNQDNLTGIILRSKLNPNKKSYHFFKNKIFKFMSIIFCVFLLSYVLYMNLDLKQYSLSDFITLISIQTQYKKI